MIIHPLSDVSTWPKWVIMYIFTTGSLRVANTIGSIGWKIINFGTFIQRLGKTIMEANERGLLMRGWYQPLDDGGAILGVLPKSRQQNYNRTD